MFRGCLFHDNNNKDFCFFLHQFLFKLFFHTESVTDISSKIINLRLQPYLWKANELKTWDDIHYNTLKHSTIYTEQETDSIYARFDNNGQVTL